MDCSYPYRNPPPSLRMPVGISPIKDVIHAHSRSVFQVADDDIVCAQRVNVRRFCLFSDTLMQFKRATLDLSKPFCVHFCGELAVDTGGPKRELFCLFRQEMPKQSSLFAETSEGLAIVSAVNTCEFKTVGKILAAMIFLGGSPPQCFVPAIADFIVYDEVRSVPDIGCVQDYSVRSALITVNSGGIVSIYLLVGM